MLRRLFVGLAAALLLHASLYARAEQITFFFGGEFTNNLGGIRVGDAFTGHFTFESTTPDSNANPTFGRYFGAITEFSVAAESSVATATTGNIFVDNNQLLDGDAFDFYRANATVTLPSGTFEARVFLQDNAATALSSDAMFLAPPDLNDFTFHNFFLVRGGINDNVSARLDFLSLTRQIPEPATLLLLSIGLAGLCFSRRRRVLQGAGLKGDPI